ncbi:uncharacterized protein LOC126681895 [Mercurialis annua]|uniref:uncharacterized protein LOC126681895 n=1 Tax=Mercurialis annua TaxID=3986 RepID=UPI00215FF5B7|nr:uncharacterized protein LOC126681895 [Mercurialis annua]
MTCITRGGVFKVDAPAKAGYNWRYSKPEINEVFVNHFTALFNDNNTTQFGYVAVPSRVNEIQNDDLCRPVVAVEVKNAVFSMHDDKSPGPDGFNPAFYKKYWNIVGADVVRACEEFFESGSFKKGFTDTAIVLIPKIKNPENVGDLRPISLCNVVYKIIAKVLANRMKSIMPCIISENQSAFVENRLITDNFLIAFEVGHYLKQKRRGKNGAAALKVDMSKAYDRVRWDFIRVMMLNLGFNHRWVDLIMACVMSVRYTSIGDNFSLSPIVPSRGLRQGDPLSPYLFIICAEGLTSMLVESERQGRIHGISICRGAQSVSHLFFADDCYLFFRANLVEAEEVKGIFDRYEQLSGQKVNFHKSNLMLSSNMDSAFGDAIARVLSVQVVVNQGKYLGLPSLIGRNKRQIFQFIKERIWQKMKGWSAKFLSRSGKEVLIKSIAQAIPNYIMNVFLIPHGLCDELERMMNSFWWGRNQAEKKGINWASWTRLCDPKKFGGLGFKKIREFNVAMLGKQAWRMISMDDNLMVKVFKAKYFPNCSFLEAKLGSNPSYVWRSIFESQEVMKLGARVRIGDGWSTRIWRDPWLCESGSGCVSDPMPETHEGATVNQLMEMQSKAWDMGLISDVFSVQVAASILRVPLSVRNVKDRWFWLQEKRGNFTVKSCYRLMRGEMINAVDSIWSAIWRLHVPMHVRNFVWRMCSGFLPTYDALANKKVFIYPVCPVCGCEDESACHLFISCRFAQECWRSAGIAFVSYAGTRVVDWVKSWLVVADKESACVISMVCWHIWSNRNSIVWSDKRLEVLDVLNMAGCQLTAWRKARESNPANDKKAEENFSLLEDESRPAFFMKVQLHGTFHTSSRSNPDWMSPESRSSFMAPFVHVPGLIRIGGFHESRIRVTFTWTSELVTSDVHKASYDKTTRMRAVLIQQGCVAVLGGENNLLEGLSVGEKANIMSKAHSTILLSLSDEVFREVIGEEIVDALTGALESKFQMKSLINL